MESSRVQCYKHPVKLLSLGPTIETIDYYYNKYNRVGLL